MTTRLPRSQYSLSAVLLACLAGCVERGIEVLNEHHCANQQGNATCVARYGGTLDYCAWGLPDGGCSIAATPAGDGCVVLPPEDAACYSPCGGRRLAEEPGQRCLGYPDPIPGATDTSTSYGTSSSSTTGATTSTDDETGTTTDEETETTTAPRTCSADEDCTAPSAPACDLSLGECVPCSSAPDPDEACRAFDRSTPVCADDTCVACSEDDAGACTDDAPACLDHECVECTPDQRDACDDAHPVCGTANTCVPCSGDVLGACDDDTPLCIDERCVACVTHDECPAAAPGRNAAACDHATGACFPDDAVWHVDGDADCELGDGTPDTPYCTLAEALDRALELGTGTIVLHDRSEGGIDTYAGVTVPAGLRLAILAAAGERPLVRGGGRNPGLHIEADAVVYLDGIAVSQGAAAGLEILGTVYADDVEVSGNRGFGVLIGGSGRFEARRSRIVANTDGAIRLQAAADEGDEAGDETDSGGASTGASSGEDTSPTESRRAPSDAALYLENCFVAQTATDTNALTLSGGVTEVLYSTIVANFGESSVLACDDDARVTVRNAVLASRGSTVLACDTEVVTSYSAADAPLPEWFANFNAGDLALSTNAPAELLTAARWQAGDPTTDIDGTARPRGPEDEDVAGADVPAFER